MVMYKLPIVFKQIVLFKSLQNTPEQSTFFSKRYKMQIKTAGHQVSYTPRTPQTTSPVPILQQRHMCHIWIAQLADNDE